MFSEIIKEQDDRKENIVYVIYEAFLFCAETTIKKLAIRTPGR